MRGTKLGLLLELLLSVSTFTIPLSVAEDAENAKGQQQFPYDAKEFRMDTWKYQENFEFPDEENDGPWKQGFDLKYDSSTTNHRKVYVHVVPWTHIDIGPKSSYTNAFNTHISKIITSVVSALEAKPSRRFIWPEVCVLQRWYVAANEELKASFRRVVSNGQLEIATGGWVMADEALTHYETLLDELSEGHDWLQRAIGAKPKIAFSVDAAGHSPVMSYILRKSGMKGEVINRIHYAYKKELAKNRALDFMWEPSWSSSRNDRMLTHVLPFYSYDMYHTCGPDPGVCSKYDFTKTGKQTIQGNTVVAVTAENVREFAEDLSDQYKKQSLLFRNNHILVLLGGNSYYETTTSLDTQLTSYQTIFDHINSDPSLNMGIAFSNLSHWFRSFNRPKKTQAEKDMPIIRGDFFPYADEGDDYWSGFYSTRGFYKRQSRTSEALVRSAQTLFTLLTAFSREPDDKADITAVLQRARRALDIYQNHNGITGVSSKPAMREYAKTIHDSRWAIKNSMLLLVQHALSREGFPDTPVMDDFEHNELKRRYNELPAQSLVRVPSVPEEVRPVVFVSSLPHTRTEYATLVVDSKNIHIMDADGHFIQSQIAPVIEVDSLSNKFTIDSDRYVVTFPVTVPPMGITTVFLTIGDGIGDAPSSSTNMCDVYLSSATKSGSIVKPMPSDKSRICLQNDRISACFNSTTGGMITLGKVPSGHADTTTTTTTTTSGVRFEESYPEYSASKSGQTVLKMDSFTPKADTPSRADDLCLVRGMYSDELLALNGIRTKRARVYKKADAAIVGTATTTLENDDDGMAVPTSFVELNVVTESGYEDVNVMRFRTDVNSEDKFVTDINGFAYAERKYRRDKPIPASVFPVTTTLYTEDSTHRVSFHFSQPLGAVCHSEGANGNSDGYTACEFMVDRHSKSDDGKGISDKVDDGVPAVVDVRITIEDPDPTLVGSSRTVTELSHTVATRMNRPLQYTVGRVMPLASWTDRFGVEVAPLSVDLPADVEVAAFRPMGSALNGGEVGITLARHLVGRPMDSDGGGGVGGGNNNNDDDDDVTVNGEDDEGACISIIDMFKCAQATELTEHTLTFINELSGKGDDDISDGVVCLKKGSMRSFSFNIRADGECRTNGVGYPRRSKWNANGAEEEGETDDNKQQQQQQYDGEDDDFFTPTTIYNGNNIEDDDNYDNEIANAILAYSKRMGAAQKLSKHIIEDTVEQPTKKEDDGKKNAGTGVKTTRTTNTATATTTTTTNAAPPTTTTTTTTRAAVGATTEDDIDNQQTPPGIPIGQAIEQQEQKEAAEARKKNENENKQQTQIREEEEEEEEDEENEEGKDGENKQNGNTGVGKPRHSQQQQQQQQKHQQKDAHKDEKNQKYTRADNNLDDVFVHESTTGKFYGLFFMIFVLIFALLLYIKKILSPRQFGMILIFTCITNAIMMF